MRLLILLFLPFTLAARQPPDSAVCSIPDVFYQDRNTPLILWIRQPDSINFKLFDRWGELLFETTSPDFKETELLPETLKIREYQPFLFRLIIYHRDGSGEEQSGVLYALPYYCAG